MTAYGKEQERDPLQGMHCIPSFFPSPCALPGLNHAHCIPVAPTIPANNQPSGCSSGGNTSRRQPQGAPRFLRCARVPACVSMHVGVQLAGMDGMQAPVSS